jgi:hypothetical protein
MCNQTTQRVSTVKVSQADGQVYEHGGPAPALCFITLSFHHSLIPFMSCIPCNLPNVQPVHPRAARCLTMHLLIKVPLLMWCDPLMMNAPDYSNTLNATVAPQPASRPAVPTRLKKEMWARHAMPFCCSLNRICWVSMVSSALPV